MIDPLDVERLACELLEAEHTTVPVPLLTDRYPDLGWAGARAIACACDDLRRERGDGMIGYKLGWTSAAMREALGIEQPNWGTLWTSMAVSGVLDASGLIHPKIEPELVYRVPTTIGHDLATAASVSQLGGSWALGLEIVDPRFVDYGFRWLDNTADNSSAARVVIGPFARLPADLAPARVAVEFTDGRSARHGVGSDALDDPCAAVAWLARSLCAEGAELQAGQLVFTGGLTRPFDLRSGDTYTLLSVDLPTVGITVR